MDGWISSTKSLSSDAVLHAASVMALDVLEEVPQLLVAFTEMVPAAAPQFMVAAAVPCPVAIVTLAGTVQVYVRPAIEVVLNGIPKAEGQT